MKLLIFITFCFEYSAGNNNSSKILLKNTNEKYLTLTGDFSVVKSSWHPPGPKCETSIKNGKFEWFLCPQKKYSDGKCAEKFEGKSFDDSCQGVDDTFNIQQQGSSSLLSYKTYPKPQVSCLWCVVQNDTHKCSEYKEYKFKDRCGTPLNQDYKKLIVERVACPARNREFDPRDLCQSSPPQNMSIMERYNADGDLTYALSWNEPKYYSERVYGYSITGKAINKKEQKSETVTWCFIKSGEGRLTRDITNIFNWLKVVPKYRTYEVTMNTLPVSPSAVIEFKENSKQVLCEAFRTEHHYVPKFCYIMRSVTYSNCSKEYTTIVSWSVPDGIDWLTIQNRTFVEVWILGEVGNVINTTIPKEQTNFTVSNANMRLINVYLCDVDGSCIFSDPLFILCQEESDRIDQNVCELSKVDIWIPIYVITAVFVVTMFIISVCLCVRMRRFLKRIRQRFAFSLEDINFKKETFLQCPEKGISVLLIYPSGCVEVERVVLYLAQQMDSIGIRVLAQNLQTLRVASEGLSNVLTDDFTNSDYVVVLCTEPDSSEFKSHLPYTFVLRQLISTSCMLEKSSINSRYIAVYFNGCDDFVPPYLRARCYNLPASFEHFFHHLHGIQSYFSAVFQKIFQSAFEKTGERKKELSLHCAALNIDKHASCNEMTCRKGQIKDNLLPVLPLFERPETSYDDEELSSLRSLSQISGDEDDVMFFV